jgi:N6-adenosine-specific RNA methylase IME4
MLQFCQVHIVWQHELLNMGVAQLQDDGMIFMWVTGEAYAALMLLFMHITGCWPRE